MIQKIIYVYIIGRNNIYCGYYINIDVSKQMCPFQPISRTINVFYRGFIGHFD
jgi:hypothetical protein